MKKIFLFTTLMLMTTFMFGMRHRELTNREVSNIIDWAIIGELKEAGYTVFPEVIVTAYRNPQDTIRKKSNYEKYWEEKQREYFGKIEKFKEDNAKIDTQKMEFDDLYYQPSKDGMRMMHKRDTLKKDNIQKNAITKDPITINNYYYNDNDFYYASRINRFHHNFWFDYYSPFYSPYYGWNSPYFYDSWYWGYNSWYGWNFSFTWNYPYYGWYSPYWHRPRYYIHNDYNYYSFNQPIRNNIQYGRRERPSSLTMNQQPPTRRIAPPQEKRENIKPMDRPVYNENRRSYAPTYETPRMSTRPQYNNSRVERGNMNTYNNRPRTEISTQSRTQVRTETRTYQPSMERRSSTYDAPSRSYSPPATNRSSNSNFSSSPSMDRRSSSGSFNSGSGFGGGSSRSSSGGSGSSSSTHSSGGRR
jgi:uncharacterized membrane protein YgcG